MKTEDKYKYVIKEYRQRAWRYDLSYQRFLSISQTVAVKTLNPKSGERILDAGCGTGAVMQSVVKAVGKDGEVVGVDLSEDMLSVAREKLAKYNKVVFKKGNLEHISCPDNYFDGVVSVNVMHYFHNIDIVLKEFYRLLKPAGRLVLVGFCTDYFFFAVIERLWRIFVPAHIRAYSLNELSQKVKQAGFEIMEGKRFRTGWFWRSMVLKGRKV